jgi:hypothetical protein
MTAWQLTLRRAAATSLPMEDVGQDRGKARCGDWWKLPVLAAGLVPLGGCVSVNAPDGPIVIELNINIRSEVVYRLAQDAGDTIEENSDIF